MATMTIDECLLKQKEQFILQAPSTSSSASTKTPFTATTSTTLSVALVNNTSSSTVYAYISGLALDNNSAVFLLER